LLAEFRAKQADVRRNFRHEQAFLSDWLYRQGKMSYWPDAWCRSFKYHCIPRWPSNYWRAPMIPEGARILIFHGEVNPPDALVGRRNRRLRYVQAAPWVSEHWTE